jgi:predicted permease
MRHAWRTLKRAPGFSAVVLATLALGIGATAAIFTVIRGVLLSPLPYRGADRLVAITTRWTTGRQTPRITGGDFVDIRDGARALEATSYYHGGEVGVQMRDHADFVSVCWTTPDLFRVFAIAPVRGRVFGDDEIDRAAIVSEDFAVRQFGSADAALAEHVGIENRRYEIVGIAPREFRFPKRTDIWVPAGPTPYNLNRTAFNFYAVARLKPNVPAERAQAELTTIARRLARDHADTNAQKTFLAVPLREQMVGSVRPTLRLLFGAVLMVLLVASANTANLLLARAVTRSREIAVRVSLGATRWRLVRQLLAESVLLSALGGAGGIWLASLGTRALLALAPGDVPRLDAVRVDWTVVLFTALVSLATAIVFGMVPALQSASADPQDALRSSGRTVGSVGFLRLRSALVIAEISLAFVLAVTAGLLVRSLIALNRVDVGYRTERMLVMYAHAPARTLDEALAATRFFDALLAELRTVPGASGAAAVMGLPGGQYGSNGSYAVEGKHVFGPGRNLPEADFTLTSPAYFATLGIAVKRGRDFDARDRYDGGRVAIVSEALARETFPGEDPIGRRIVCGLDQFSLEPMTIVGVVGDVRQNLPAKAAGPILYMPLAQHPFYANEVQVIVRSDVAAESLVESVRRVARTRNPEVALKFTTVERMLDDSVATPRFRTVLFIAFGALAVLLAVAGVYGVMSYVAAQRTAEFGVRMALGARPSDVIRLMLGRAARLAVGGLLVGVVVAIAATRLAESLLFAVKPLDAATFAIAIAALLLATLAGAAAPAWRASRVDAVRAIRME